MKHIPLAELNAELTTVTWEGGEQTDALRFDCPLCVDREFGTHSHLIPFRRGNPSTSQTTARGRNVWGHTGGSTVEDLTLAPSYLCNPNSDPGLCRLHVFVRSGVLQVLNDSRGPRARTTEG